ncbi:response regulator [Roseiflexus sp.]|jgi:DNA-binding NarL/FixJ family response regulator
MDCSGAPTPGRVCTLAAAAAERRALFRSLLECLPQTVLVAETDDGRTALDYVRHRRFDLALLDISLRRLSGLTVARQALRVLPGIAVVIISDIDDPPCLLEALRIGVTGYLPAAAAPHDLVGALQRILAGEVLFDAGFATRALQRLAVSDPARPMFSPKYR